MLRLKSVRKFHGSVSCFGPTSLHIKKNETLVVIGPSGSGKSTLIRLLVGLILPDEGEIFFQDQPLTSLSLPHARLKMGYVIQGGGLYPHLTARENVTLMPRYLKWYQHKTKHRLEELMALTHFPSNRMEHYPIQLSGGERQRVSLMRALMLDPDVLFLDEPFGALDPLTRSALQRELKRLFQVLKKTVVLVTHDLAEARLFANTIMLIKEGKPVQKGTFEDLLHSPSKPFVTEFIEKYNPYSWEV